MREAEEERKRGEAERRWEDVVERWLPGQRSTAQSALSCLSFNKLHTAISLSLPLPLSPLLSVSLCVLCVPADCCYMISYIISLYAARRARAAPPASAAVPSLCLPFPPSSSLPLLNLLSIAQACSI